VPLQETGRGQLRSRAPWSHLGLIGFWSWVPNRALSPGLRGGGSASRATARLCGVRRSSPWLTSGLSMSNRGMSVWNLIFGETPAKGSLDRETRGNLEFPIATI
jgi:hypothetical protein